MNEVSTPIYECDPQVRSRDSRSCSRARRLSAGLPAADRRYMREDAFRSPRRWLLSISFPALLIIAAHVAHVALLASLVRLWCARPQPPSSVAVAASAAPAPVGQAPSSVAPAPSSDDEPHTLSAQGIWADGEREVWVVGEKGLLLRSLDGGVTWGRRVAPTTGWLNAILRFRGALYLGGEGLFRSTDNGATWKVIFYADNVIVNGLWSDGRQLFVATLKRWDWDDESAHGCESVLLIGDGTEFRPGFTPPEMVSGESAWVGRDGALYLVGLGPSSDDPEEPEDGAFVFARSRDGGRSFQLIEPEGPLENASASPSGKLYAMANGPCLASSDDGGRRWRMRRVPEVGPLYASYANDRGGIWLLGDSTLVWSLDGGATWREADLPVEPENRNSGSGG
jgi:hypothetical protein